jgi:hypothetical protein
VDMSNSHHKLERHEVLTAEKAAPPSLTDQGMPLPSVMRITRTASPTQASTRWLLIWSLATRGSPRC